MNKRKIAFHTLGCKVNQYETERMKEQFIALGFEVVDEEAKSDVYIINTCTVTNLADRKSRQYIRRMKKQAPASIVAVTGCYSQVSPEELIDMPEVDIVTGNGDKNHLIDLVKECIDRKKASDESMLHPENTSKDKMVSIIPYEELTEYRDTGIITSMENRTRAYIKIQEGCDRFCSYCLIPFARGHVRSRNPVEIVEEARILIEKGFKEIVLTGINTALYGAEEGFFEKYAVNVSNIRALKEPQKDEKDEKSVGAVDTSGLGMEYIISQINDISGEFRIRLSSLEPTVVNASYVKRLMSYEKLCPHLHLSIQSGSDRVIGLMNRHYTREEYLNIVKILREHDPGYGITTDIIVGFPGEEEHDFEDSLDMVERVGFLKVHAFKYSKRHGTRAEKMKDQVSGTVKNERSDRLIEAGDKARINFLSRMVGTTRNVLFEEGLGLNESGELCEGLTEREDLSFEKEGDYDSAKSQNGRSSKLILTGYTDNYIKVYAEGMDGMLNGLFKVKLLEIYKDGMKGEIENG